MLTGRPPRSGDHTVKVLCARTGHTLQVMHGQRMRPRGHHPLTDLIDEPEIAQYVQDVAGVIGACVDVMPTHQKFIEEHCAADPVRAI